ncbi:MAG: hypothetical protein R3E56_00400 [Burkholderiaceae bacterium]
MSPVFRFFNSRSGVHFYTISEEERTLIIANLPHYVDEGVAYYASKVPGSGLTPLYRFYRRDRGLHFYTSHYTERDAVISLDCAYRYEGAGYYVFDANAVPNPPDATPNATVLVVGDSLAKGYGISIGGNPYNFVSKGKVWTEHLSTELRTRTNRVCNRLVNVSVGGMRTVEECKRNSRMARSICSYTCGSSRAGRPMMHGKIVELRQWTPISTLWLRRAKVLEVTCMCDGVRVLPESAAYRQGMTAMYQGVAINNVTAYQWHRKCSFTGTYYHGDSVHLKMLHSLQ